jgi:mannose-6-phosphate isomerase-like protein (cupin superfamily)
LHGAGPFAAPRSNLIPWVEKVTLRTRRLSPKAVNIPEETIQMQVVETPAWETWRPGVQTRMLVSAETGAAQLCIFEQLVAPGTGAPTHSHPVEEVLTVREGEADMWIGADHVTVYAGQSLLIPAGRLHGFRNSGQGTLHIHAILASPIFEATPEGEREPVRRWLGTK